MRSVALAIALLLVACASCASAQRRVEPLPYGNVLGTWPSGLRLVAYELPHRLDVMVSASYRVGSADDPPGKEGLAHLVEHLAFRARPAGGARLWDRLEALGVEFDGRTRVESTDYYVTGDPEQLDDLLRIEADRLRDPIAGIDEGELRREREVVLRELAALGAPSSIAAQVEWVAGVAFPGHPCARSPSEASLRAITLEDVRAFARHHYTPARVVLVVTGPFPPEEAARRARAAFGELAGDEARPVPPVADAPPPPDLDRPFPRELAVRAAPVEKPVLWLAWPVPSDAAHGGARVVAALRELEEHVAAVLGGADRARVVSLDLHSHALDGVALVLARIGLRRADDAQPLLDAVRAGLRFGDEPAVGAATRAQLRARLVLEAQVRLEALDLSDIARWLRATGRADYLRSFPEAVASGLGPDAGHEAARWLREERLVALAVVPGGPPPSAPPPLPGASALGTEEHHPDQPEVTTSARDASQAMRPPRLASAVRRRLDNGVEIVVARRPGFRVISVHLVVRTDPAGPLQRVFEVLALRSATCASRPATVAGDRLEFGARAPSPLLPEALDQVGCRAGPLRLDRAAFERSRDELAAVLERTPESIQERAGQQLLDELYPAHAYSAEVTATAVRAFRADEAERWLARTIRPERSALILTGDVELTDEAWGRIEDRFGKWRPPAATPGPELAAPGAPVAREVTVVDRPGWPSAEVVVAVRIPPRGARDEPAFRTLAWRLEDALRSRLRLEEALAYRVEVSILEQSLGSALLVATTVDGPRAGDALRVILDELAALRGPFSADEVERWRWHAVREAAHGLGTSWRNALRLQEMFVHRLPPDEWDTFAARAARLTGADLEAAVRGWGVGREAVVVVGDAARVAPRLRVAGVTPEIIPSVREASTPPSPR